MTTEMTVAHQNAGAMSVYDRIADPLAFIEQMGKVFAETGACGCQKHADGKLIALACLSERQSPFDIERRYHLMDGKLRKKSDVMLAELRQSGGDFEWLKDGKDGTASIKLTYKGKEYVSTYSMQDAERAGLVREKSGWTKNPANMLRARATSEGIRMIAPEIAAGIYTPEEGEDIAAAGGAVATPAAPAATSKRATKAEQEARKAELQQAQAAPATPTAAPAPAVVETTAPPAVQTTAAPAAAQAAPATAPATTVAPATTAAVDPRVAALTTLDTLCSVMSITRAQLDGALKQKNAAFPGIDTLDAAGLEKLIENLKAKVAAKQAA